MDVEKVRNICIAKPLTEECFPFDDCTLVMKVCGKMYAVIPLEQADKVVLKCNPEYADEFIEHSYNEVIKKLTKKTRKENNLL